MFVLKKRRIIYVLFIAFIITFLSILVIPISNEKELLVSKLIANDVKDSVDTTKSVGDLQNEYSNKDIVGVLEIPNTNYSTLIMQSKDNIFYLRKDVNKKYSRGGTPFLDYRTNIDKSKKLLIYGHNSKYIDMPFKILESYYDKDFYEEHKYIILKSSKKETKYEIFSIYVEPGDWSYLDVDFKNDKEYEEHLNMLKSKSLIDTGIDVSKDDEILILQTCSTKKEYQKFKKKFLLIVSRKVEG